MAVDMLPDSGKQRSFGTKLRDITLSSGVNGDGVQIPASPYFNSLVTVTLAQHGKLQSILFTYVPN